MCPRGGATLPPLAPRFPLHPPAKCCFPGAGDGFTVADVMRRVVRWVGMLGLVLGLMASPVAEAAGKPAGRPPGAAAAETLSQVTGIAISPLLGVGAVGAYRYFKTPESGRAALSWYAQPWFWGPALLVVGLCALKDALGTAVPTALKKPLDVAEVFENKLSGLIATGAILPMTLDLFRTLGLEGQAGMAGAGLAALDANGLLGLLMVPVAFIAYAAVFLVSHAINILILVSPFGTVDAALKSLRTGLLATVAGTSFVDDRLGAAWALVIVLACLPLAGWALRLAIFGHVFAWDYVSLARTRTRVGGGPLRAFLARRVGHAPRRTYGTVSRDPAGNMVFTWRPWLVGSPRSVQLPASAHAIGRGLLHSELLETRGEDSDDVLNFPPRYNTHEPALAEALGLSEVRDVGLRAMWAWVRSLFGGRPATTAR